ncbi:hypothetical protein [Herbiconiux flava]|uniref:Uncharacterized protein n=1 Tax=Herbiconiux flava TaxID=881268 RepID=A0A852SME7_9MICO|nr:hypothetical protein [Herbiconiux flava]NYD69957.1 hypothetical protein [Herbiconiux flava]
MTDSSTTPAPDDADQPDVLDQGGSFGAPTVDASTGDGSAGDGATGDTTDERDTADQPDGVDERGEKSSLDPDHESFAAREAHSEGSGPNGSGTSSPDGIGAYSDGADASAEAADAHADSPDPDADGVA